MVREYYGKICAGEDVRANLIALRDCLKEESARRAFAYLLGGEFDVLTGLLKDKEPKIRKNAALILGKMESEDLLPVLFDAYKTEETRFVRADYLKAISGMDYRPLVPALERRLEELRTVPVSREEEKHVSEELRTLQAMLLKYRKAARHRFTGYDAVQEMILVTNRCQREATVRQIRPLLAQAAGGRIGLLSGGVRVRGAVVRDVLNIRTWSELLFPMDTQPLSVEEPAQSGRLLARAVLEKLRLLHGAGGAFLFRIELKSRILQEKKGAYIRKISDALERESSGMLVNSVTDYEVEIRLLERKDGTFAPLLKLYTIPQKRFAYRKESVASSIAPVNAALAAELARPYLKEKAQVLDPFCGVGTMLIERHRAVAAGPMYGIDIFGEAIDGAYVNTELAGCRIFYINKDFFEFEHEYLFDEIFTDMPQVTAAKGKEEIALLYARFFEKAGTVLKKDAVLVLYAQQPQFVHDALRGHRDYRIAEEFLLNEKNQTTLFVICRGSAPAADR